jgi:hypothetical protein
MDAIGQHRPIPSVLEEDLIVMPIRLMERRRHRQ